MILGSLWPRSLAGQTMLVLAGGLLLVILGSALVAALTFATASNTQRTEDFVGRVVTLVAIAQAAPNESRSALFAATARTGLKVSPATAGELVVDMRTRSFRRQLVRELGPLKARVLAIGHPRPASAREVEHFWSPHGPVLARVALADGTVLDVEAPGGTFPLQAIGYFLPALSVVGIGLGVLAIWLGRRVTRPLGVFAAAATRLGTDVAAASLPERGPSELRAAAQAFNQMQRRIRRLLDDRVLMLAAVAHDLRTPITRLRLRAEYVDDTAQQAKMLVDLDEMEVMIDSALAFAREETVIETRVAVDVRALLDDLAMQLPEVRVSGEAQVMIDARIGALRRALRNLLENAVKYGHRAEVLLSATPGEIQVVIEDAGPGIPEAEFENVFRPFYRLEPSRSRDTGGTGLGLSTARSIVRSHGGDITLRNRPTGGLVQTVVLPRQSTSEGDASRRAPGEAPQSLGL